MTCSKLAISILAVVCFLAPPSSAQAGDPGYEIDAPAMVSIGAVFELCFFAPPNSIMYLLIGTQTGSIPTKVGTLGLGFPLLTIITFPMMPSGQFCFPPDRNIPCYPDIVGSTMYMQFVAIGPDPEQRGISNVSATKFMDVLACSGPLVTYTQGAYGALCQGSNPACTLQANFATIYPNGLILGDPDGVDGDSEWALHLTSAAAVAAFLPEGSTRMPFDHDSTDPANSEAGVLSGQLTAAKINVDFDNAGVFDAMKSDPSIKLADMIFISGVDSHLIGMSVQELIDLTDDCISGATPMPVDLDADLVPDVDYDDLSAALTVLNENFDNGDQNNQHLALP